MSLSIKAINRISGIFDSVYAGGRNVLYEYEVYEILKEIGLAVPAYIWIEDPAKIDSKMLKPFKDKVVLKVVSPQIVHKQKIGGVKVISELTAKTLKNTIIDMEKEILAHFDAGHKPDIKGYILVEFIPFNQSLGHEVLFGLKHDDAFGPVLTVSKGGDDAEFFAKYYDPANLIIPPIDDAQALALANSLNIKHKFESTGHPEYVSFIARAAQALGDLACSFSCLSSPKAKYIIKEMDINPFVISQDHRFVAVDGFAKFELYDPAEEFLPAIREKNLDAFFKPKGIAIIGVSTDPTKKSVAKEIAYLLHRMGREDIYLINKNGGYLKLDEKDYPLYKNIAEINETVELAIYAAPAKFTIAFIRELSDKQINNLILISGIPSDVKYADFKVALNDVVSPELRIIGPNCMGVYYGKDTKDKGLNTIFISEKKLEIKSNQKSNTALITQSGALAVTMLDHLGKSQVFKAVVSFGNKYDVNINDLIKYFTDDKNIRVIALYLEGLEKGEGLRFFEVAKTVQKPIIVYKSGQTEAGAMAAASHTAAMSCSYEVFRAACQQTGIVLAEKIEDQIDYVKIFSLLADKKPRGYNLAGVFNAGFETTIAADELNNLKQFNLSQSTYEKLKNTDKLGLLGVTASFLDITPTADDGMYIDYAETLMQDDDVDCLIVSIVPHPDTLKSDPETCKDSDSLASRLVGLSRKYDKPMVVSVNAGNYYQEFITVMEKGGLPVFKDVRSALKSLDIFITYHMNK